MIVDSIPIEHSKIVEQIVKSEFGIVSYKVNPSNENCMPTKVFEYLSYGLPIISKTGTIWTEFASKFDTCMSLDFEDIKEEEIAPRLTEFHQSFIPKNIPEVMWATEEKKLISLVDRLL